MRLYLMQHGKAKPKQEDSDPSLTDEGRSEVRRVADFLARTAAMQRLHIKHSGKTRALQTAETLAGAFEGATVEEVEELAPLHDPTPWAERLDGADDGIVLVGHLPYLARLTSLLITGDQDRRVVQFSNAGMVCLERGEDDQWTLLWSVVPQLLAASHLPQEPDAINPSAELLVGLYDELDELKRNVRARNWGLGCFVLAGALFFGVSASGGAALAGIIGLIVLGCRLTWSELRRLRRMRMIRRLIGPDTEDCTLSPSSSPNQRGTA